MSTAAAAMIDSSKPLDVQFREAASVIEEIQGADRLTQRQQVARNKQYAIQRELLRSISRAGVERLRVVWTMTLDHADPDIARMHCEVQETLAKIDSVWLAKRLKALGDTKPEGRAA